MKPRVGGVFGDRGGHRSFILLFLLIGGSTSAVAPFTAVLLLAHGVDTATIGLLSALAAVTATVLVPVWGHLADVSLGRVTAFRIALILSLSAAVALALPVPVQVFSLVLASFGVFLSIYAAIGDALAVGGLAAPESQYGKLRAGMSFSFAVGVIGAGFLYNAAGYGAVPAVSIVWCSLLFVALGAVPDRTRDPQVRAVAAVHGGDAAAGRFGSLSRAVAVQPRLWAVLAVFALAYAGIMGAVTFVSIRIVELGGQPSDVALTFGVSALAEIPSLILARWILHRLGVRWLVCLALTGFGVCILSWGVLPSPVAINATRVLTGFGFGSLLAARVVVIARLLPNELQATGQTLLQAATSGFAGGLGSVAGGAIYALFGPLVFFAVAGAATIAGGIGAFVVLYGPVGDATREREPLAIALS